MVMVLDEISSDGTFEVLLLHCWRKNCLESCSIDIIDDEKRRVFSANIENADDALVKLNELVREVKPRKMRYLMKNYWALYTCVMSENHSYHPDVKEFFPKIIHLEGFINKEKVIKTRDT